MWSIWIVALSLIHYGYILANDVKPNSCDVGDPLNDVFCGRNKASCPIGYHCKISPFDTNGICCRSNEQKACLTCCGPPPCCSTCIYCDGGDPLNDVFCGRNQPDCPKGYHCKISPFDDTNGICCKSNDDDVPLSTSYGIYIYQYVRYASVCSDVIDFNERNQCITVGIANDIYSPQNQASGIVTVYNLDSGNQQDDRVRYKVCYDTEIGIKFEPCLHTVTCQVCAFVIDECPICRQSVDERLPIY